MRALLILAIVLCAATGPAPAQRYHREGGYAPKLPPNEAFDRGFFVCRMMYTSIQFWRRSGGTTTSERGPDSAVPHLRAIRDANNRIMVLMTHNTDIGDSWEREGEDYEYFYRFAHDGYALGINALVHVMAH